MGCSEQVCGVPSNLGNPRRPAPAGSPAPLSCLPPDVSICRCCCNPCSTRRRLGVSSSPFLSSGIICIVPGFKHPGCPTFPRPALEPSRPPLPFPCASCVPPLRPLLLSPLLETAGPHRVLPLTRSSVHGMPSAGAAAAAPHGVVDGGERGAQGSPVSAACPPAAADSTSFSCLLRSTCSAAAAATAPGAPADGPTISIATMGWFPSPPPCPTPGAMAPHANKPNGASWPVLPAAPAAPEFIPSSASVLALSLAPAPAPIWDSTHLSCPPPPRTAAPPFSRIAGELRLLGLGGKGGGGEAMSSGGRGGSGVGLHWRGGVSTAPASLPTPPAGLTEALAWPPCTSDAVRSTPVSRSARKPSHGTAACCEELTSHGELPLRPSPGLASCTLPSTCNASPAAAPSCAVCSIAGWGCTVGAGLDCTEESAAAGGMECGHRAQLPAPTVTAGTAAGGGLSLSLGSRGAGAWGTCTAAAGCTAWSAAQLRCTAGYGRGASRACPTTAACGAHGPCSSNP